jgi:hypothetical protein
MIAVTAAEAAEIKLLPGLGGLGSFPNAGFSLKSGFEAGVMHFEEFRVPNDNKNGGNAGDWEVFSGSVKSDGSSVASSSSTGMRGMIGVRLSS